jgi:acetoacetyl-CoA synthetase
MTHAPLWTPSSLRREQSNLSRFVAGLPGRLRENINDYKSLHQFSIAEPIAFWTQVWDFAQVKAAAQGNRILEAPNAMPGARFFPDARLNYAENLLRKRGSGTALVFRGEDKLERRLTWDELHAAVSRLQKALQREGVSVGDRICAIMPNMPEAVIGLLAASSMGAVWSSCSPDFGARGILDRFGQIAPRILLSCDAYHYAGKTHPMAEKLAEVLSQLPSVEHAIIVNYTGTANEVADELQNGRTLEAFTASEPEEPVSFAQLPFNHPLYILYSSGTTGVPKCIVHSAGGILLKHATELLLQTDVKPGDKLFYFSTCGWMMWNWLVSGLMAEATLLLYDGSPFYPSERALFDYADAEGMTVFGTSAKYIDAVRKTGWQPRTTHHLSTVKAILSTGSPLSPESFDFVYEAIKPDVHLTSISGGTDICGCFVAGNPWQPVWRGEIQGPVLGMAVDVFDDEGHPLAAGKGELVCKKPFPSMPVMFWNDADGRKYRDAYFSRFPGIWAHGDFAEWTPHDGLIIHGRSDATLNPGGVRIGTAEIYAQVERIPDVIEALAIGQEWDNDVRVVLFIRLKPGAILDEKLIQTIKAEIRRGASPRHVPARIVAVADIPRTKSGKITELAVREIIHGRDVKNKEALANPEALELFKNIPDLES